MQISAFFKKTINQRNVNIFSNNTSKKFNMAKTFCNMRI